MTSKQQQVKVILDELTMTNTVHPKNVLFLMLISIIINMLKNGVDIFMQKWLFFTNNYKETASNMKLSRKNKIVFSCKRYSNNLLYFPTLKNNFYSVLY